MNEDQMTKQFDKLYAYMDSRFDSITQRFDKVEADLATKADASAMRSQFDRIESRFDTLEGRMDRLDGRMDQLDGRMDSLDGKIGAVDGKVGAVEGKIGDLGHRFDALERTVNGSHTLVQAQLDEIQQSIESTLVERNTHIDEHQSRQDSWIRQLASATSTRLTPEP